MCKALSLEPGTEELSLSLSLSLILPTFIETNYHTPYNGDIQLNAE